MRLPAHLPPRLLRLPPTATASSLPRKTSSSSTSPHHPAISAPGSRCLASISSLPIIGNGISFTSTPPHLSLPPQQPTPDQFQPPDPRTLQLGRTVRTLHERLPQILQSPLPSSILSPNITLHLFPTTHPHLPTVSGRIAYGAALRTAPVAWGRVPFVGNSIEVLSERMVRNGRCCGSSKGDSNGSSSANAGGSDGDEKLIVKWRTRRGGSLDAALNGVAKKAGKNLSAAGETGEDAAGDGDETFCGVFVFEFDEQGRIGKHVIENTEEDGRWDRMTRVVSVTDWLLGRFNGRARDGGLPALALCEKRPSGRRIRLMDRRGEGGGGLRME